MSTNDTHPYPGSNFPTRRVILVAAGFLAIVIALGFIAIDPATLDPKTPKQWWWSGVIPLVAGSALPPLVGIALVIATRRLLLSLAAGALTAAILVAGPAPWPVVQRFVGGYLWGSVADLFHLAVLVFTATLIGLVASIDGEVVRRRLTGLVPARTSGGILAGLAILTIVRQAALIVTALATQAPVHVQELAVWIDDFTVGVPAVLVGGILLWRRKALGHVAGAGLLLAYGVLALGVIPFMVLEARYTASRIDAAGIVLVLVMAALCFTPFGFFVRGAASDRS